MKTLFVKLEDQNTDLLLLNRTGDARDIALGRDLQQWVFGQRLNVKLTVSWSWDGYNQEEAEKRMSAVAFLVTYSQQVTMEKILTILNG